jgi:hypothetical protein
MDEHLDRKYLEVELYEKVIVREKRRKWTLISIALALFLFLCGIPIYKERLPKWESLKAARQIAVEIEKLKTDSIQMKKPLQLHVLEGGRIEVRQVSNCETSNEELSNAENKHRDTTWSNANGEMAIIDAVEAKKLNLNFAIQKICFDPIDGMYTSKLKKVFVIIPVKDLAESRLDRASYVEVESASARISIN